MPITHAKDIRTMTELKLKTREILDQVHQTGRAVVVTVNGKADAVIIEAAVYDKQLKALHLARLISEAEAEVSRGQSRSARNFLGEFKKARKI